MPETRAWGVRSPISGSRDAAASPRDSYGELAKLLLLSSGEGIYGVDLDGNCTFANPACARLLGFDSAISSYFFAL